MNEIHPTKVQKLVDNLMMSGMVIFTLCIAMLSLVVLFAMVS